MHAHAGALLFRLLGRNEAALTGLLAAGRKHQLRKACANVLHAPILGDGRYALLRSPEQHWFQERLQALPALPEDRPEEALGSMLRCNRHLQLHCFQVRS